jgi:glucose/mannose-6-phosphate isomerase
MDVNKIDKSNFRQFILNEPLQFKIGLDLAKDIKIKEYFTSVTISGMGGSAWPANLLRAYCNSLFKNNPDYKPFQIYINRYYFLPPEAYDKSLNIISSYSGNTEETVSSLEDAHKNGLKFVSLASGGEVEKLSKKFNAPLVKLPIPFPNFQPRMSTGYFFGAIFQLLINHKLIPDVTSDLVSLAEKLDSQMKNFEKKGIELAKKMKGKTIVIYSTPKYKPVAMVWKIKINENSKTPAFWNFFPEASHNEMVGFTNPQGKFFVIMLKDADDYIKNQKRYEATAKLLGEKGVESEIMNMEGKDVFYKMFSSIMIADWASYYLALEYKQDPTPVAMVEDLKKILAS